MTVLTYPSTRIFVPSEFTAVLQRNITQTRNPLTRRRKTVEHPGALWVFTLLFTPHSFEEMAEIEAFWNEASDADNTVALWHMARPVPRGTLQTNTTTAASASEGVSALNLTADTGKTILLGDMAAVTLATGKKQLVQVTKNVTSVDGVMTAVSVVPPLVGDVNNGATVTVVKPATPMRLEEPYVPAHYVPGYAPAFPVVLVEDPEW